MLKPHTIRSFSSVFNVQMENCLIQLKNVVKERPNLLYHRSSPAVVSGSLCHRIIKNLSNVEEKYFMGNHID